MQMNPLGRRSHCVGENVTLKTYEHRILPRLFVVTTHYSPPKTHAAPFGYAGRNIPG
jgi:hypothetical protein